MKKILILYITFISLVIAISITGIGFATWHFFVGDTKEKTTNIEVTSFINFDYMTLSSLDIPERICFEDPLNTSTRTNENGIFFLKEDSSGVLNKNVDHTSGGTNCTDIVSFEITIDLENVTDLTSITTSDFDVYLGIEVTSTASSYFNLSGYSYTSTSYGKKITTGSITDNKYSSGNIHLSEVIYYSDKDNTFNNLTNVEAFFNATTNATFTFKITVTGANS